MSGAMLIISYNLIILGYFKLALSLLNIELNYVVSLFVGGAILASFYPMIAFVSKYLPVLIGYRK